MNEQYQILIAEYLQGTLDKEGQTKLAELIAKGEVDAMGLKTLEELGQELEFLPQPKPSPELRSRFYAMLEQEQAKRKIGIWNHLNTVFTDFVQSITLPRLVYSFLLLLIGGFLGSFTNSGNKQIEQLSAEVQTMRQMMMVSMLQGPTTTDRLRAVNISAQLPGADHTAINALLFTLNNDPSDNVRLQAVEALVRWGNHPAVREGLIASIARQKSDIVIVELADAVLQLGLKNAAGELERLKSDQELNTTTKEKLTTTIAALL